MPSKIPPALVREREVRAWALACAGKPQTDIAAELGITQPAVCQILKRVSTRALKQLQGDVEQRKALHTARLEHIFSEAMGAWEASKKPRQKSRSRKTIVPLNLAELIEGQPLIGGAHSVPLREETVKEAISTDGDVAKLQTALQADAELRKLWGINAPKKIDLLDQRRPLEKLTDAELEARARENAALLAAEGDRA